MSFSTLVSSLISKFLGDYIEGSPPILSFWFIRDADNLLDFNPGDLEINLFKGEASITNLKLKASWAEKFNVPFTIKEGCHYLCLPDL